MSRTYYTAILVTNRTDYFSNHDMLSGIHRGLTALGVRTELFIVEPDGHDLGSFMERMAAAPLYAAKHTWASRAGIIDRALNGA